MFEVRRFPGRGDVGCAGAEGFDVDGGAADGIFRAIGEVEVVKDVFDDVGYRAVAGVVLKVRGVKALAEFGAECWRLGWLGVESPFRIALSTGEVS